MAPGAGTVVGHVGDPDGPDPRTVVLLLGALLLLAIFLGLEPLLSFSAWGSDSGEYASLTQFLLQSHRFLLTGYTGWGFGYPYFPGTFEIGAGVAAATGADPLLSLELAVPALGAFGALPLFLTFRRILPSDRIALLGAALTAVASPRLLVISHAAPLTVGDLLWLASLWALVEQRRDPRWWVVLALTAPALVVTHHLSSYFFLLSGLGLVAGLELYAPWRWSRRFPLRELVFLGSFTAGLFIFWFTYAPPFARILTEGLLGISPAAAPVAAFVGVALVGALIHLRRKLAESGKVRRPVWHLKWPSRRRMVRDALLLGVLIFGALSALFFLPLPGTDQKLTPITLAWFLPMILYIPFAAGGKGLFPASRLGPAAHTMLAVIGLSAVFALVTNNAAIPLDRHAEYLIPPLSLLTAAVLGQGLAAVRRSARPGATAVSLVAVGLLLGAAAATAYPPPAVLEGFQEGFTYGDQAMASWMAVSLPRGTSLASDHRLSDEYFYDSGGNPATWDNASCLFLGNNDYCAAAELRSTFLPNPPLEGRVDVVAADATMRTSGVALNPSRPALPMSSTALQRLAGPTFVVLYSDGGQTVWWVAAPYPAPT